MLNKPSDNNDTHILTYDEYVDWILKSKKGESIIYHVGFIGSNRARNHWDRNGCNSIARLFWSAAHIPKAPSMDSIRDWGGGLKLVSLVQRKIKDGHYEYIAQKSYGGELTKDIMEMYRKTLS